MARQRTRREIDPWYLDELVMFDERNPLRIRSGVSFAEANFVTSTSGVGRQREYAAFGCSRSAGTLPRPVIATCE